MSMSMAAFFGMVSVVFYGLAALGVVFFAGRKIARHDRKL